MKRRILSLTLALCILLTLIPSATAYTATPKDTKSAPATRYSDTDIAYAVEDGNIYFNPETGTITDCDASVTSAVIPSEINSVAVTRIGESAFDYCYLKSVTIPDSVTSIGKRAFNGCYYLKSAIIGNGVRTIGSYAFYNCDSLKSVNIPDGVTSIDSYAFYGCTSLPSVTIPDGVTSIGDFAFYYCTSLTSVTIPNRVTSIGERTFYYCTSLTSVTIGNGVKSIAYEAFYMCTSLTSVTIPDSVKSIDSYAFYKCTSLTRVTIGKGVESICGDAFYDTAIYNNDGIWIDGVLYIDNWLIEAKTSISGAYSILDGTVGIASDAFKDCTSLTSVEIPDSVTNIGEGAFYNTAIYNNDGNWVDGVLYIDNWLIEAETSTSGAYSILDGTVGIASDAFKDCTSLTSVEIPDSVKTIGGYAFDNCTSLKIVTIGNSVTSIGYAAFFDCTSLTSVEIPDSVTSIGDWVFYWCTSLASVTIPDSVTSIGRWAFFHCSRLPSVTIPDSVTNIGDHAFSGCERLTSVTIPNSVTSIGSYAFYGCDKLTSVYFLGDAPEIGTRVFQTYETVTLIFGEYINIPGLTLYYIEGKEGWTTPTWGNDEYPTAIHTHEYTITTTATCTEDGVKTYTCTACGETKIEAVAATGHDYSSVVTAPTCTEQGYTTYTCAKCGDSYVDDYVDALGHSYVDGVCTNCGEEDPDYVAPTEPTEPTGIVAYAVEGGNIYFDPETGAITGCDESVTAAVIPSEINGVAVTAIGDGAFWFCTGLTSVTIPDSVTSIGYYTFYYCESLMTVTIPDSVTSIGDSAFCGCKSLTSVTIPNSVTSIGRYAFYECRSLTGIWVDENNKYYFSDEYGVLFNKDKTILIQAPGAIVKYTIPNTVTSIGDLAFEYCTSLTNVMIPDSVTSIGDWTFSGCTSLKSVMIGNSVTSIGYAAFFDCTSLTSVYFLGDAPELGKCVFQFYNSDSDDYTNLPGLTLYYIEGKEGWTTPEWNGYPTAKWSGFVDVSLDGWYASAVEYIVENGLMNGMGKNEFRPEEAMTRAMLVTVLWRYAGSPAEGENTFNDLTQDWYVQAVAWASSNGIVNGYPDGTFKPDEKVTREQLATIVYRFCNTVGIDTSARADLTAFPDANKVNSYASDAISWAVSVGLITGITHGGSPTAYLEPQTSATRAQVATILMRFIENVAK